MSATGGKGWWDPTSDAKGEVFSLVQRRKPAIHFGHARKRLREFAGLSPSFPIAERAGHCKASDRPVANVGPIVRPCGRVRRTWRYLARKRFLPSAIIEAASAADVLREGPPAAPGSLRLNGAGSVAHVDIRGPTYKSSLTGGRQVPLPLAPILCDPLPRLVVAEASIDALSVAAIRESSRRYALRGKRRGHGAESTIAALEALSQHRDAPAHSSAAPRTRPDQAIALQNATERSRKNSACHSARLRPPIEGGDWNDVLRARSQYQGSQS